MRNKKKKGTTNSAGSQDMKFNSKPDFDSKNNRRSKSDKDSYNKDRGQAGGRKVDEGGNAEEWYNANPQLIADAAAIPFSWSTGLPYNLGTAEAMEF